MYFGVRILVAFGQSAYRGIEKYIYRTTEVDLSDPYFYRLYK